jgi:predicted Zn-dependent protease|tara:strand:+ start:702 stop:917 length:216 start_codon:yes stop_codon:yes gene_type:complete
MANKENKTVEKAAKEEEVDYRAKWEEAKENLLIQLKESLEQIEIHKTRATKIQGVIEVNDQMFLEEEKSEG